jgi:hypothetical protein
MSTVPSINITVHITDNLKYDGNIIDDLLVGSDDLTRQVNINNHMDEVSSHIAFWGSLLSEAQYQSAVAELKVTDEETGLKIWQMEIKRDMGDIKELKSEKARDEKALLDNLPKYQEKLKQISDLKMVSFEKERDVALVQKVFDSFRYKKDMLISLATNLRSERERELMLNEYNDRIKKKYGVSLYDMEK